MDTVLIAEDDNATRHEISFALSNAGYETLEAPDAMTAIDMAVRNHPAAAILNWRLPDMECLKLLRYWQADQTTATMGVLLLGDDKDELIRIAGLQAGADGYVAKPFKREELIARIQAVLRRINASGARESRDVQNVDGLQLDAHSMRVVADGRLLHLGPLEFRLLHLFMSNPERAFSRPQIVDRLWRDKYRVEDRTVDVHVRRLRQSLRRSGHDRLIQTVRGIGYRFSEQPSLASFAEEPGSLISEAKAVV